MSETESSKPKGLGFRWLLLISFVLVTGSFIIDQTLRWSSPWDGLLNGLVHIAYYGSGMLLDVVPWSVLVWGIYRGFGWSRFRTPFILAPAIIQAFVLLSQLVSFPPTARGSFKQLAKVEIPTDVKNLQYFLSGGGTVAYSGSYYFECIPEELTKLLTSMEMGEGSEMTSHYVPPMGPVERLESPPDTSQWIGGRFYSREIGGRTFEVSTDPTRTKIYIWVRGR